MKRHRIPIYSVSGVFLKKRKRLSCEKVLSGLSWFSGSMFRSSGRIPCLFSIVPPAAWNEPTSAPRPAHEPAIRGMEREAAPITRPAAQPPAAPFQPSSLCRKLANEASEYAKSPPMSAIRSDYANFDVLKIAMVPPVRENTPMAPALCFWRQFCAALTTRPATALAEAALKASLTGCRAWNS